MKIFPVSKIYQRTFSTKLLKTLDRQLPYSKKFLKQTENKPSEMSKANVYDTPILPKEQGPEKLSVRWLSIKAASPLVQAKFIVDEIRSNDPSELRFLSHLSNEVQLEIIARKPDYLEYASQEVQDKIREMTILPPPKRDLWKKKDAEQLQELESDPTLLKYASKKIQYRLINQEKANLNHASETVQTYMIERDPKNLKLLDLKKQKARVLDNEELFPYADTRIQVDLYSQFPNIYAGVTSYAVMKKAQAKKTQKNQTT